MRLRALYIDQLFRLKHVLREKRRAYLHALRTERESLCSIHDQTKDTISERKIYQKLKALNKYQRRNGVEAILHKKFLEKRQKVRTTHCWVNQCDFSHLFPIKIIYRSHQQFRIRIYSFIYSFGIILLEPWWNSAGADQAIISYAMRVQRRRCEVWWPDYSIE